MNCREAERLIDAFFDGELDGRSMRDAAMHITRCKRCEAELNDREQLQQLLVQTIESEIADVDLGRIWAAVEPTVDRGRRRRSFSWRELRAAAASSRSTGALLGASSRGADDSRDLDDGDDLVGLGSRRPRGSRVWGWSLTGGTALAASVLLALVLLGGETGQQVADGGARVASVPAASPAAAVASARVAAHDASRAPVTKQVQVESVNFPRSSVAMWSEPATDTTVIWIEDEELVASDRR